jgi:hypothetical protein
MWIDPEEDELVPDMETNIELSGRVAMKTVLSALRLCHQKVRLTKADIEVYFPRRRRLLFHMGGEGHRTLVRISIVERTSRGNMPLCFAQH